MQMRKCIQLFFLHQTTIWFSSFPTKHRLLSENLAQYRLWKNGLGRLKMICGDALSPQTGITSTSNMETVLMPSLSVSSTVFRVESIIPRDGEVLPQ